MLGIFTVMIMIALMSATIRLYLHESGVVDFLAIRATKDWQTKFLSCAFCQSFWLNFIIGIIFVITTGEVEYITTPLFAAPITRMLT